jgi:putative ABC transport system permease protein
MRPDISAVNRSWWRLAPESARIASTTRVVSGLVLILAIIVPSLVLATAGSSIESQAAIIGRIDESGTTVMTLVGTGPAAVIPASAVDRIAHLSGVAWVVGLGPVFDVRTRGTAGGPTPARAYRAVRAPVRFGAGGNGAGAFVSAASAARVGLAGAYSVLDPGAIPVVGWFVADDPLGDLNSFVLTPSTDDNLVLDRIIVAASDAGWVDAIAASLPAVTGLGPGSGVTVERSQSLLDARGAVADEVATRDRQMVIVILAAATALACIVVFTGTIAGRRDFGRRRALGASQRQLTILVMLTTLWPSLIGAVLGTAVGSAYLGSLLGHTPDWRFPVSVGVLTVIALVCSSAPPAAVAATRDPLRVLRVP